MCGRRVLNTDIILYCSFFLRYNIYIIIILIVSIIILTVNVDIVDNVDLVQYLICISHFELCDTLIDEIKKKPH